MTTIVARVKAILWIQTADYDDYLNEVTPNLLEYAEGICLRTWRDDDGEPEDVPGPVVMFIARAAEFYLAHAGITSEQLEGFQINMNTDMPGSITKLLNPCKRVKFV